jgi:hypothetical protein
MKKIINFTPTGTQTTRSNSFAPLLPNEIIEDSSYLPRQHLLFDNIPYLLDLLIIDFNFNSF